MKRTDKKSKDEVVRIYRPRREIEPEYMTNVIVDNITTPEGRVYNRSEENVILSKKEVDSNHK
ncbi:MAG TPA: hypothetical protein IAD28_03805 [Candidatus Faeciplasma avium]|uniref:Uncharacterized protein n=1 Tax=Candidatus Faeciplasma avium TaxID=2840798 RepID=A0A9D1NQ31_9FIRM|nr:hypothetical protein [Candidatus Faeciplasma avium]